MGSRLQWTLLLAFGAVTAFTTLAADKSAPAFSLRLEGVKFDYPGIEHWAEVERPDGQSAWAFAIYTGNGDWTVPFVADIPGTYRLRRVEGRQGEKRADDVVGKQSKLELKVAPGETVQPPAPVKPDLVDAGGFKTFFAAEEPWCINDHTLAQGPDGAWHLFGITHPKPLEFFKDPGHRLAHATAPALLHAPWQARPPAVTRDWEKYREYLLWAPHVVCHGDTYYMYVCVGDKSTHRYRIHLLTSPDLETWTRSPANPMVVDGFDARDPMVIRAGDQWVLYYTANSTPECGNHLVACVTSKDLVHWDNRRVVFIHPRAGSFGGPTESPFVVRRGDNYYLFVCDNEWTDVYLSRDPFRWEFSRKTARIRSHASEVVRDADGQWYLTHAGWTQGPVSMAPLRWHDGLDDAPASIPAARK